MSVKYCTIDFIPKLAITCNRVPPYIILFLSGKLKIEIGLIKLKKMRALLFLLFFTTVINTGYTQVFDPVVISGGGSTFTKNDLKMTSTLGQPVTGLLSSSGVKLRQGFQYNYSKNIYGIDKTGTGELSWSVYPNPAGNIINIKIPKGAATDAAVYLYDQYGQLLQRKVRIGESELMEMDIAGYPPGVLILKFFHQENGPFSCQKIIKK